MENKKQIYGKMLEVRNRIDAIKALDSNYLENEDYKERVELFDTLEKQLKENVIEEKQEKVIKIYKQNQRTKKWDEVKKFVKKIIADIKNISKNNKE